MIILPCPSCGQLPAWREQSAGSTKTRRLVCATVDCNLGSRMHDAASDEESLAQWNSLVTVAKARMHLRKILRKARADLKP